MIPGELEDSTSQSIAAKKIEIKEKKEKKNKVDEDEIQKMQWVFLHLHAFVNTKWVEEVYPAILSLGRQTMFFSVRDFKKLRLSTGHFMETV